MTAGMSDLPQPAPLSRATWDIGRCAARTVMLMTQHRLHQPGWNRGRVIRFADGSTAAVYRETVADAAELLEPAVLIVGFRLRGVRRAWSHWAFRQESLLNTFLFAGFDGFVSKLWLRHDEHGVYRGIYQWDGPDQAEAYVRSLWWALALVSDVHSIRYTVLPGRRRIELLDAGPGERPETSSRRSGAAYWWLPVADPSTEPEKGAFDSSFPGVLDSTVTIYDRLRFASRARSASERSRTGPDRGVAPLGRRGPG